MNKSNLTDALARETTITSREAESVINTILAAIADALCHGESIEIRGFGSFIVSKYNRNVLSHRESCAYVNFSKSLSTKFISSRFDK